MSTTTRSRPHWTDVTALALVGLTAAVAVAAVPRLPAELVVGWRLGLDGTVSRTVAPRLVGVALLPTLAAACYGVLRTVRSVAGLDGPTERRVFDATTLLVVATLAAGQVGLVVVNLR